MARLARLPPAPREERMLLGIMGAVPDEIRLLQASLQLRETVHAGKRDYLRGTLHGQETILAFSRIGKVAAASTATTLIERFNVGAIFFTGVAGGLSPSLNIGDIVVGDSFLHHDLDARPLFPRWEIPLLGLGRIQADPGLTQQTTEAARRFLDESFSSHIREADRAEFGLAQPQVKAGLIVSGDQFIDHPEEVAQLQKDLPEALCVEMEGAAVAQVCYEHGIPLAIVRTISDKADHSAAVDFARFSSRIAAPYSAGILEAFLEKIPL
jgi:adenosylhomocysteine nucleosidase